MFDEAEELEEWYRQIDREVKRELLENDRVYCNCRYVSFVSKSKGKRNGRRRLRRCWKEVELFRYCNGWHLPKNFPFDIYATELLGQRGDDPHGGDMLREHIREVCDRKGEKCRKLKK